MSQRARENIENRNDSGAATSNDDRHRNTLEVADGLGFASSSDADCNYMAYSTIYFFTSRIHLVVLIGIIILVLVLLQPPIHLLTSDQEFPGLALPNRVFGVNLFGNGSDDGLEVFVGKLTHFVLDGFVGMEVAVKVGHPLGNLECLTSVALTVPVSQHSGCDLDFKFAYPGGQFIASRHIHRFDLRIILLGFLLLLGFCLLSRVSGVQLHRSTGGFENSGKGIHG